MFSRQHVLQTSDVVMVIVLASCGYIVKSISGHVKPKTIKFVQVFAYSLLLKNATIKSKNKALEQRLVDKENSLDNMSEKRSMATCMTFVSVG